MAECERGDLVFISSVATDHHAANGAPYNMGKEAMEALAMTVAKEEQRNGIRVNVVGPQGSYVSATPLQVDGGGSSPVR